MEEKKNFLSRIPLFSELTTDELLLLARITHEKRYKKDTPIFFKDEVGESIFIIKSGQVKVMVESEDGREVILSFLEPSEWFGEMSILDGEVRSATVITTKDSDLLMINRNDFLDELRRHPEIAIKLLKVLSRRLRVADSQIESLAFLDVSGRVAKALLEIAENSGKVTAKGTVIDLEQAKYLIADRVASSRETIYRVLNKLKKRGYISVNKRVVTMLDMNKLKEIAHSSDQSMEDKND